MNTVCSSCQLFLDAAKNSAEHFLFFTCIRIVDFFLWVRCKILSDRLILRETEYGTLTEHYFGVLGDKQDLPSLVAIRRRDWDDGEDGEIDLLSSMEVETRRHVLPVSSAPQHDSMTRVSHSNHLHERKLTPNPTLPLPPTPIPIPIPSRR